MTGLVVRTQRVTRCLAHRRCAARCGR